MNETIIKQAEEKLIEESKNNTIKDQKAKAVLDAVKNALIIFCKQDEEFAQAIVENKKTLTDCCTEIMKGVGNSISDLEVYKKAVEFYFKGADISFEMKIDLCASVKKEPIKLSLLDFLE